MKADSNEGTRSETEKKGGESMMKKGIAEEVIAALHEHY